MKSAIETDDLEVAALSLHHANGGFGHLTARSQEEATVQVWGEHGDELLRRLYAVFVETLIVVQELRCGRLNRLYDLGMAVPRIRHQNAGSPVKKRVAIHVCDDDSRSMIPHYLGLITDTLSLYSFPSGEQFSRARTWQWGLDRCHFSAHLAHAISFSLPSRTGTTWGQRLRFRADSSPEWVSPFPSRLGSNRTGRPLSADR